MPHFKLPDVGEGLTEAEIISWKVAVGDVVKVNDVLVDIETAKSIVELPSPFAGEVTELLVAEGETVHVGTPIVGIGTTVDASSQADAAAEKAPERQAMLVGYGPSSEVPTRRRRTHARAESAHPRPSSPRSRTSSSRRSTLPGTRPMARPPVRKLAKDLGIDLSSVPTAGEIVTRADLEAFAGPWPTPSLRSRRRPRPRRRRPRPPPASRATCASPSRVCAR